MIKRIKFTPEAFERYLDGLDDKFNTTILWNTLSKKSEYGAAKNEKAYQMIAASKATQMARKLGLNEARVTFYSKCLGAAFPACGIEGKERIVEYAIEHDLPYDEVDTMASVVEESFSQSGKFVVEGLREILLDLFDCTKCSDCREIELAKIYHEQMEILKIVDSISQAAYDEEESRLDAKIAAEIDEIGIIKCRRRLSVYRKEYRASDAMTAEEIQQYYEIIDKFREYAGDECLINFILHAPNPF